MAFQGLSKQGVKFFAQLAAKQDRDWFKAHKHEYQELWEQPMKALMDELQGPIGRQYPGWKLMPAKHFRIYRDVRFSKDKSPFKTQAAAMIGFPGGEELGAPAALYLHLGLEDVFAAGHWSLPPDKLKRFRALVADDKRGKELARRAEKLEKEGFKVESFEALKRVPPGFDPQHPRARFLKLKGLGLTFPKPSTAVRFGPGLPKWIVAQSARAATVVGWLEEQL